MYELVILMIVISSSTDSQLSAVSVFTASQKLFYGKRRAAASVYLRSECLSVTAAAADHADEIRRQRSRTEGLRTGTPKKKTRS